MEQIPSREADSRSSTQEISHLLWDLKVHCRDHNSPPQVTILCRMNAIRICPPIFPKINFNIILPSTVGIRSGLFRFSEQNFLCIHLSHKSRDSSVGIATRLDDWGSRVRFPAGAGNFSLHHRVQNGTGPHPASYPMVPGALSFGIKWPGREADHSLPFSAEVKE
jgi:hypothetical protein